MRSAFESLLSGRLRSTAVMEGTPDLEKGEGPSGGPELDTSLLLAKDGLPHQGLATGAVGGADGTAGAPPMAEESCVLSSLKCSGEDFEVVDLISFSGSSG